MLKILSGSACLLAAVLQATSGAAQQAPCNEDDEGIVITGGVVSTPSSQAQSMKAVCGSRPVGVELVGLPITEVVVTNGEHSRRYTKNVGFVKDLAVDVAAYSVRLNCPDFYDGLSVAIYSFVPTRCTYKLFQTYVQFDETAAILESSRQLREDPDVLRALLTLDRRLWPYDRPSTRPKP